MTGASAFLAAVAGIAYFCLDPLVKAAYVIRCYLGESIGDGEDLRAELRGLRRPERLLAPAGLVLPLCTSSGSCSSAASRRETFTPRTRLCARTPWAPGCSSRP